MSDSQPEAAARSSTYKVVINDEEQYSIWPAERPVPKGWSDEGTTGTAEECLAHVENVWTDMRPRSIRDESKSSDSG